MNGDRPATVRPDIARVVRAVARYVATKYEVGSAAGRWAIHESRAGKRRNVADELDLEEASAAEILDAIALAHVRRAIYAPPTRRHEPATPRPGYDDSNPDGLPCVAPTRLVANILPVKRTRASSGGESGVRAWRLTFAWCLRELPPACEAALLQAASEAQVHVEYVNLLAIARSEAQRLRSSARKRASRQRSEAESRVAFLQAKEREAAETITSIVRSAVYRAGLRELVRVITASADREREIFGIFEGF